MDELQGSSISVFVSPGALELCRAALQIAYTLPSLTPSFREAACNAHAQLTETLRRPQYDAITLDSQWRLSHRYGDRKAGCLQDWQAYASSLQRKDIEVITDLTLLHYVVRSLQVAWTLPVIAARRGRIRLVGNELSKAFGCIGMGDIADSGWEWVASLDFAAEWRI